MLRSRPTILYVDDDPDLRLVVAGALARARFDVTTAGTVDEALAALGARRFEIVLSDYWMEGATGEDLLRAARERGLLRHTRASIVSADPKVVAAGRATEKPFGATALVDHVARLCEASRRAHRVRRAICGLAVAVALVVASLGLPTRLTDSLGHCQTTSPGAS